MKSADCLTVSPGESLTDWQKLGLDLVARWQGRDVILAIDLTGSVNFNDEGRTRLGQIIRDSLKNNDSVYLVPFADNVQPIAEPILIRGKEDIDAVLKAIPWQSSQSAKNTDIQRAEWHVYTRLARLNQCRLTANQAIKPQSVVWITDAPLSTAAGITSQQWIETPKNSPFRLANSPESLQRQNWLNSLPINLRTQEITATNGNKYKLSVVDIAPTAQEFCTPAPGGQETCLINPYLLSQLWLPALAIILMGIGGIVASILGIRHWLRLHTAWTIKVPSNDDDNETQKYILKTSERINIGGDEYHKNTIPCPGEEIRCYLERRGNHLYLKPTKQADIFYRGNELTQEVKIDKNYLTLTYQHNNQDIDLEIQISKK
ncbi:MULTISPECIES: vWA domain-containing protein [unclassified Microcystis]|jgi:hypothetical protein|uniref:vWA domain-containing protein n=1 Tax=unclassified Microcystis TaxID=2643300 RepID=UPI0011958E53|nr:MULTISPECIES: vWA domain-containing protein [unclassified Microcystis]MCA2928601.1 VWA domain-containing protein [Microcystis sp. M020S1]MCA2934492.1 VWA domain-containing protein [Microcystis sp. M015S1]MCA2622003.1 VWA domain-containing protein [Microcystis sp. M099S2]MCA2649657.1 VWA domain-containing protein [Microcystis sp. M065S2]MCA2681076.1 VWA domain-containing protein [Microcystis sp. M043S2]